MLSSILKSKRAEKVNILIIDTFVMLNSMLLSHKDILLNMEEIQKRVTGQDEKIELLFNYLKQFIKEKENPRRAIEFKQNK